MSVELNHTIIPAKDKWASAKFLADILNLEVGPEWGYFVPVKTGNGVTLDFSDSEGFRPQHYAFLVSEAEFDAALARIRASGVEHYANFRRERPGEINHLYGGRGVYFDDPVLDELLGESGIAVFSDGDRRAIAARWHALDAWPDFLPALVRLRQRYICVSFTILSLALVVDVSRRNAIAWDAVITCEMLGVYKPRPEAYRRTTQFLQTATGDILMVACHNFDLDAARAEGYRTAFVHRPAEWGPSGPPDPNPNPATDLAVSGFAELANRLGT